MNSYQTYIRAMVVAFAFIFFAVLTLLTGCGQEDDLSSGAYHDAFPVALNVRGNKVVIARRGKAHLGTPGKVVLWRLHDGSAKTILDNEYVDDRTGTGGILSNGNGVTLSVQYENSEMVGLTSLVSSDGEKWKKYKQAVPSTFERWGCHGNTFTLEAITYANCFEHDDRTWQLFLISTTTGTRWTRDKTIWSSTSIQLGEASIYPITRRTLLLIARDTDGPMQYMVSNDVGATWDRPRPVGFGSYKDVAPILVKPQIGATGVDIYAVYADRKDKTIKASKWDGDRFEKPLVLVDEPDDVYEDFGYPSILGLDLFYYVSYEKNKATLKKAFY